MNKNGVKMETLEAIYDNGNITINKNIPYKKGKVLITILDNQKKTKKIKLPSFNMGNVEIPERKEIYNGKLPD